MHLFGVKWGGGQNSPGRDTQDSLEEKTLEGNGKLLSNSKQFLLPLLCGRITSEVIVSFFPYCFVFQGISL